MASNVICFCRAWNHVRILLKSFEYCTFKTVKDCQRILVAIVEHKAGLWLNLAATESAARQRTPEPKYQTTPANTGKYRYALSKIRNAGGKRCRTWSWWRWLRRWWRRWWGWWWWWWWWWCLLCWHVLATLSQTLRLPKSWRSVLWCQLAKQDIAKRQNHQGVPTRLCLRTHFAGEIGPKGTWSHGACMNVFRRQQTLYDFPCKWYRDSSSRSSQAKQNDRNSSAWSEMATSVIFCSGFRNM